MNIKSGVKTTEFWMGLAAVVIGALLASDVLPSDHWAIKVGGILAVALASLGYSVSRGRSKRGPGASLLLPLLLCVGLGMAGCGTTAGQTATRYAPAVERSLCVTGLVVCQALHEPARGQCFSSQRAICEVTPASLKLWLAASVPVPAAAACPVPSAEAAP